MRERLNESLNESLKESLKVSKIERELGGKNLSNESLREKLERAV